MLSFTTAGPSRNFCPSCGLPESCGRAKLLIQDADGRQVTLAELGAGEFFSELELNGAASASLSVVAVQRCELLYVTGRDFRARMLGNLEVSRLLVDGLAARLCEAYSKIESLAFLGVHARVVEALLECATSVDGSGIVDRGSEEVARRVAASREMVSRVLKSMREQGLIRRHKRRTIIVDPDRLGT